MNKEAVFGIVWKKLSIPKGTMTTNNTPVINFRTLVILILDLRVYSLNIFFLAFSDELLLLF